MVKRTLTVQLVLAHQSRSVLLFSCCTEFVLADHPKKSSVEAFRSTASELTYFIAHPSVLVWGGFSPLQHVEILDIFDL